jgi:hypothetical protein
MASNFPDTVPPAVNPDTSTTWQDGDSWSDPATGITYYWYDPVWKTDFTPSTAADDKYVEVAGDTMTGDLTVPSLNGGPLAGFRNHIINGDFRIWQRGTGPIATNMPNNVHLADRWEFTGAAVSGGTNTVELYEDGNTNKYRANLSGNTGFFGFLQKIEADSLRCYAGQEMTLSWYSSNSSSATYLSYQDSTDTEQQLPQVGNVISLGNNKYSQTFTLPTAQIGQDLNSRGLTLIVFPDGDVTTPPSDGTYDIWNVQLEPGPVATPFEHRPIGTELALCQRYYQRWNDIIDLPFEDTTTPTTATYPLFVPMRAAATISGSSSVGSINCLGNYTQNGFLRFIGTGGVAGGAVHGRWLNGTADAEL